MNMYYWNKVKLNFEKIKSSKIFTVFLICVLLIVGLSHFSYKYGFNDGKEAQITEKDIVVLYHNVENCGFSRKNFYEYLKEVNIKFPKLVFAQAMKECGFKSPLFKENNNPFGMKEANKRPNIQNGTENGYAYYDTWKKSIIDYALYQSYIGLSRIKTEEAYLLYLKEMNYYDVDDPNNENYLNDLKYIADNIEDYLKE